MRTESPSKRGRRRWRVLATALLCMLLVVASVPLAVAQRSARQALQIEAAFLLNFVRYTDWPPGVLGAARAPYIVAVVGDADVADTVRAVAIAAGSIRGRRIAVVQVDFPAGYGDAAIAARRDALVRLRMSHVVFAHAQAGATEAELLRGLVGVPTLTVGDSIDFAAHGGMLGLVQTDEHLAFEANPSAIQGSGVIVSAKVLKLARLRTQEPR